MCGIIGYIGNKKALPILISTLEKLEYRGYDSSGVCLKEKELKIIKEVGKINQLKKRVIKIKSNSKIGIGHSRWATHGKVTKLNAHPHFDEKKEIAIVHNGIIENYLELKKMLKKNNIKFYSETDSEIIAKLIKFYYKNNLEDAVRKIVLKLKGKYSILAISKKENKIIGVKNGSPLIIGKTPNENFICSDANAINDKTKNIIYLDNKEIAILGEKIRITDFNGKIIKKNISKIEINDNNQNKSKFKTYMEKEIFDQKISINNFVKKNLKNKEINLNFKNKLKKPNKIIIIGCGTSYNSGLIGKHFFEKINKIDTDVEFGSEFKYENKLIQKNDLVIGISQSGETIDTIDALINAKKRKAKTIAITNVKNSSITKIVDECIYLNAGIEISVASTKAFTSQITALLFISLYLNNNKKFKKIILKELFNLDKKIIRVLKMKNEIKRIVRKFKKYKNFIYIAKGIDYPIALEGALKLKEISYVNAQGIVSGELKHGSIAIIDKKTLTIAIGSKQSNIEKISNSTAEILSRQGDVLVISNLKLKENQIILPKTSEFLQPIINIIPLQLMALYFSELKGFDVDKPRNLAKSVTVE